MELSRDNIVSKHFSKKLLGGLDEFEVRDFLHSLAEEIRSLSQKSILQKKQIHELENLIKDFRDREHILKESIASAEKWAEKIRKDAENNSSLILERAQHRSESLIQDARHSLQTVYNDIADLKRLQLQFKTGLKAALQVQMDLLDQNPIFTPQSSLSGPDLENILEKTEEPSPKEIKTSSSGKKDKSKRKKHSEQKKESAESDFKKLSEFNKIDDQELSSLKESLSSLNKDFF